MNPKKKHLPIKNTSVSINGDVSGVVVVGDNNQTTIQKIFNIFKSDAETLEYRNRRTLLGHVENFWIKGVLDASLHSAPLLKLGIKEDPKAVGANPWTLKKEGANETILAGISILEMFDSIGTGRSLLILGAPGSGKTTMLLELTRQLIERARQDITEPIPMVFNLASWKEKLTLADWLVQELNIIYNVSRNTASEWVTRNKLLLLLDGLDEVQQENREKCVEAINTFRKEYGLTSLTVCSRSQDYKNLKLKLSFDGAVEVQPLTQEQIDEFFGHFGDEMTGIRQALEKDAVLREMAETPLLLGIMVLSYRNAQDKDILSLGKIELQRGHLFNAYIEHMFERYKSLSHKFELGQNKTPPFKKETVKGWLKFLAQRAIRNNAVPYFIEDMQYDWLDKDKSKIYVNSVPPILLGVVMWIMLALISGEAWSIDMFVGVGVGAFAGFIWKDLFVVRTVDILIWSWKTFFKAVLSFFVSYLLAGIFIGFIITVIYYFTGILRYDYFNALYAGLVLTSLFLLVAGWKKRQIDNTRWAGQKIFFSLKNAVVSYIFFVLSLSIVGTALSGQNFIRISLWLGALVFLYFGGFAYINHHIIRLILFVQNLLPWRLVPFLDYCVDLVFLRRVGGGYIFIHRLLMEHFAEMYKEENNS